MAKFFGSVTTGEGLIGAAIGTALGGLIPVALRRMLTISEEEVTKKGASKTAEGKYGDYPGKWKDHIREHASAYGLGAVAVTSGLLFAFKRTRALAGSTAIVGAAVAVPRVIADYTLNKELLDKLVVEGYPSARLGQIRIANALGVLTTSPVGLGRSGGGGRFGVVTAEQIRGSGGVLSSRDRAVKVLGGAFGANPITTMHRA